MRLFKVFPVLVVVISLSGCNINNIPTYDEMVKASWAEVENQYQRRAELVPNLVEIVRKAGAYEQETLVLVTNARSGIKNTAPSVHDADGMQQYEAAQAEMGTALSQLMIQVERYPDLKANRNYLSLMSQLEGTENRIALARTRFVLSVARYNAELRTFPGKIWQPILYSDMQVIETYYTATAENADVAPAIKL
jgi:LemA protein